MSLSIKPKAISDLLGTLEPKPIIDAVISLKSPFISNAAQGINNESTKESPFLETAN